MPKKKKKRKAKKKKIIKRKKISKKKVEQNVEKELVYKTKKDWISKATVNKSQYEKKYQLSDTVLMPGFIKFKELPNYFNACDLVINYTIRQNGYDLTMVEAMACEKVVISSNIGSTPTLIQDNINGILIEKAKPSLLAKTVISILNNNNKKEKIEKEARKTIEKSFTAETMINATEKLFYDIVNEA